MRRFDATRSLGHVRFDGTPATELEGADAAAAWHLAQALIAAESLGAVEIALETSVAYAKERFTFGRAIGSYQAVKHELVEILRRLENARSLMYYAGWAGPGPARRAAARRGRLPHGRRARRSTTRRARRSRSTAASAPRGSTTPRSTSGARSSRAGCSAAPAGASAGVADELFREAASRRVNVWTHDRWRFPLPEHHRFPIEKYTLLRERVGGGGRRGPRGGAGAVGLAGGGPRPGADRPHPHRRAERARAARARDCRGRRRWSSAAGARSAGRWRRRGWRSSAGSA